jgi:hypothetical protein
MNKVVRPNASGINLQFDKKVRDFGRAGNSPGTYYSFQTATGGRPDMGAGQKGPGIPYQEVEKHYNLIKKPVSGKAANPPDAKSEAIRRRLNGGK